jgi:hypothetical protein
MPSLFLKATIWLFTEVVLTSMGLDDLADYGEFIFKVREPLPSQFSTLNEFVCVNGVCVPEDLAFEAINFPASLM